MTLRIVVRPTAEQDIEEAFAWHEERQAGLGKRFFAAVEATIKKFAAWPDFGIVVHRYLRRANVRRFPYGVFYHVVHDRLIVVGVLHGRRAPRRWKSRLE